MPLKLPDQREDVRNGLQTLAAEPPHLTGYDRDPRWPDLTNAIHWVVDDTWWDQRSPAESINEVLRDVEEADALASVVVVLVRVSERVGASNGDARWFADPEWPLVRELSKQSLDAMQRKDQEANGLS